MPVVRLPATPDGGQPPRLRPEDIAEIPPFRPSFKPEDLAEIPPFRGALDDIPPRQRHQGKMAHGIDFDDAADLLVAACQDAVSHHAAELTACFDEFDEDGGGIDIREFNKMCDAVIG